MSEEKQGVTQWQFYSLCAKLGVVLFIGVALFLLARRGDVTAIVILSVLGALALLALGLGAAVVILDKQAAAEQRRFAANARENMMFLEQQARVQNLQVQGMGRASQSLLQQNERLARMIPGPGETVDVDALTWDVRENTDSEGRW